MSNWITAVAATTIAVVLLKNAYKPKKNNAPVYYPVRSREDGGRSGSRERDFSKFYIKPGSIKSVRV